MAADRSALVVGVDMATADVRAVAADCSGRVRAEAARSLPAPTTPADGWCEQDARQWWPTVAATLAELTDGLGDDRASVVALSMCATSGTVVGLGADGEPTGPALMYSDQRAAAQAEVAQEAGHDRWARLGLRIPASFGLPKWAWLVRESDAAGATVRLGHASDVVVGHLIGAPAPTDWSHALKSGYDADRHEWATEAMAALDIPLHLLPEVRRPTSPVGTVSRDAAAATGLPSTCEVRLGMTDACASQLAAGAATPGRFVSVLGSTLVLKGATAELVADTAGAVYSHRHPDGWWLPGGASSTGARALAAGFAHRDLAALDDKAARHGPAGCVVYPLVGRGERFPFAAPDAERFSVDGGGEGHDGGDGGEVGRYRAILEGVAFVERLGYERLARLGARAEPPVAVSGRGSRSRVWNVIRATVLDMPLVEKPNATTALGACILAAAGTLHPDLSTAAAEMGVSGDEVHPVHEESEALDRNYRRFVAELRDRGWLADPPAPSGS